MFRVLFLVFTIALFFGRVSQAQDDESAHSKSAVIDDTKEGVPETDEATSEVPYSNNLEPKTTLDEDKKPTPQEELLLNSPSGPKAPEGLYLLVRHPNQSVRRRALTSLLGDFAEDPKVYRFYIEQLNEKDLQVRKSAFSALYSFFYYPDSRPPRGAENRPPKEFMKSIIKAVSDPEFDIHKYAAYLIGFYYIEPEAREAIPTLLKLSKNYDDAAFFAIHTLGLFGEENELIRQYEASKNKKLEIALALAFVDPASEKVIEILEQEISKEGVLPYNYCELVDAFATVRPNRRACLDQIEKATKSEVKYIREQAIKAFGKISPKLYKSAIPILEKIASDPNSSEKWEVSEVLSKIKSRNTPPQDLPIESTESIP